MAVTATPVSKYVEVLQRNGTTTSGAVRTISQRLGAIDPIGYDDDGAYAVGQAYNALLYEDSPVYKVQSVSRDDLLNE